MITAVFDLDGTLADTLHDLADATNYGLKKLGYPIHPYESYRYFVGNGVPVLCERVLPDGYKHDAERLREYFTEYYNIHYLDKTRLYDGIYDCIRRLADNGVVLAVATNKPQDFARKIIEKLIPEFNFVKVLGGCSERPKKPDPAIIREITDILPADNKCYMIGDSNVDIMTAQNSGLISIGCDWGFRGADELKKAGADFIAYKPSQIADYILNA